MERPYKSVDLKAWLESYLVAPIGLMVYVNIVFRDYGRRSRPFQYVKTAQDVKLISRLMVGLLQAPQQRLISTIRRARFPLTLAPCRYLK